jgi:hypothetical protein
MLMEARRSCHAQFLWPMNLFDMDVGEVDMYSDRLGIMSDSQGKTSDSPLISLSPQTIWIVMKEQGDQVGA